MQPPSTPIVDNVDRGKAREAILEALSKGARLGAGSLAKLVEPLASGPPPHARYDPVYEILHELMRSGTIRRRVTHVPGAAPGIDGVRFLHEVVKQ